MTGIDELLVTVYADTIGIMLSFGLFVLAGKEKDKADFQMRFFKMLLVWNMLLGLVNSITYTAEHHAFGPAGRGIAIVTETALEVMLTLIVWTWFIYVDYSLYHSMDHLRFRIKYWMIPIYAVFILLFVNLFTGIVFTYDSDVVYHPVTMYYVQIGIKYIYVLASFVLIWLYKKNNGMHFVNIWNFAVPGLVGAVLTNLTPYSFMALSLSVAAAMIYFSMLNQRCYIDSYTGFYNKAYLDHLLTLHQKGKFDFGSGLIIDLKDGENTDARIFSGILQEELPEGCETVRIRKNRYLSLTKADRTSSIRCLSEEIGFAVEEWNEKNNGKLEAHVSYLLKKKDEEGKAFVERLTGQA